MYVTVSEPNAPFWSFGRFAYVNTVLHDVEMAGCPSEMTFKLKFNKASYGVDMDEKHKDNKRFFELFRSHGISPDNYLDDIMETSKIYFAFHKE